MKTLDVLQLNTGRVFFDLVFADVDRIPGPGEEFYYEKFAVGPGGSFNTAAGLARLGKNVALVEDLGNDPISDFILRRIKQEGIATDLIRMHEQEIFAVTVSVADHKDRRFFSHMTKHDRPVPSPDILDRYRIKHLHLPGIRLDRAVIEFAREARARGITVSLESQYAAAKPDNPDLTLLLRSVDLFLCNRDEALALTGKKDPDSALAALRSLCPLCVVKLGSEGAVALADGDPVRSPALDVEVVDPTGAGDAFAAGFVAGYMESRPLDQCLRMGNICGGLCTTAPGAVTALPTREKLEQMLGRG